LSKKLANDCIPFPGDPMTSFTQALAAGQKFLTSKPQSSFQIVYDSRTSQVELQLERIAVRRDFPPLFGPGDVPGYLSEEDMQAIGELVTMIPPTGILVEVGTFLGKSAVEWAKNIQQQHKDYKIICIDSFNSPIEILQDLLQEEEFTIPDADSQLTMFKHYTKSFSNVQALEAFFNKDFVFNKWIKRSFSSIN
jgi:predicted O-methyltransferase YrrM